LKAGLLIAGIAALIPFGVWDYRTRRARNM